MEFQYYGANCVRISTKKTAIIIDDNLSGLGGKRVTKAGDIALATHTGITHVDGAKITIEQPGEYEVSDISIQGIPARAHMDEAGKESATMFKLIVDDVRIAVIGHVHPDLTGDQLEALNTVDVLIIPVGGNGYTLDPVGALKLVKEIEPKIVIPTHYDEKSLNYEVVQQPLEEALKALAMEPSETTPKFKVKAGEIAEVMQLVVLEKQ